MELGEKGIFGCHIHLVGHQEGHFRCEITVGSLAYKNILEDVILSYT